jgi:hypothetical protein
MSKRFDEELRSVLVIAEALREEYSVSIDAHPGGDGTEAGVVNRAFPLPWPLRSSLIVLLPSRLVPLSGDGD